MRQHAPRKTATKASARPASDAVEFFSRKLAFEIGPYPLKEILDTTPAKVFVIDVRSADAFAQGHLPTAVNIPLVELAGKLGSLPKDRTIVTYCGDITCPLSSKAALELAQKGFKVQHLVGGIMEWTRKEYPVAFTQTPEPGRPEAEKAESKQAEPELAEELKEQKEDGGPME